MEFWLTSRPPFLFLLGLPQAEGNDRPQSARSAESRTKLSLRRRDEYLLEGDSELSVELPRSRRPRCVGEIEADLPAVVSCQTGLRTRSQRAV